MGLDSSNRQQVTKTHAGRFTVVRRVARVSDHSLSISQHEQAIADEYTSPREGNARSLVPPAPSLPWPPGPHAAHTLAHALPDRRRGVTAHAIPRPQPAILGAPARRTRTSPPTRAAHPRAAPLDALSTDRVQLPPPVRPIHSIIWRPLHVIWSLIFCDSLRSSKLSILRLR